MVNKKEMSEWQQKRRSAGWQIIIQQEFLRRNPLWRCGVLENNQINGLVRNMNAEKLNRKHRHKVARITNRMCFILFHVLRRRNLRFGYPRVARNIVLNEKFSLFDVIYDLF